MKEEGGAVNEEGDAPHTTESHYCLCLLALTR